MDEATYEQILNDLARLRVIGGDAGDMTGRASVSNVIEFQELLSSD